MSEMWAGRKTSYVFVPTIKIALKQMHLDLIEKLMYQINIRMARQ